MAVCARGSASHAVDVPRSRRRADGRRLVALSGVAHCAPARAQHTHPRSPVPFGRFASGRMQTRGILAPSGAPRHALGRMLDNWRIRSPLNTLANLGPLQTMASVWEGARGLDVKPKAEGAKKQAYVERIELQFIDPQTNGPQLFYGLRYHQHVVIHTLTTLTAARSSRWPSQCRIRSLGVDSGLAVGKVDRGRATRRPTLEMHPRNSDPVERQWSVGCSGLRRSPPTCT